MITTNEVTAISGIGGAIVGGAIAWIGGWLNQRGQSDARRIEVQRHAYAGLIGALDYVLRVWDAPETIEAPDDQKMPAVTAQAVGRIQNPYGAVRLVGSETARAKAKAAWSAAWELSNMLNTPGEKLSKLGPALETLKTAAREFLEQAEAEVAK